MQAVVVSDLHIGLPFFRKAAFMQFVKSLDDRTTLILNGDIVDNPHQRRDPQDQNVLDFLAAQSFQRRVIWIYGNHDENFRMADSGEIEFRRSLALDTRLMIVHGDDFDTVMPNNRWFLRLFKFCHLVRLRMGADPVHVAELAKRWTPLLYRVLTEQVKKNAVDCALEGGFEAITCGHTHYAEDSIYNGVRYINTGTWTEEPLHYVSICPDTIRLSIFDPNVLIDVDAVLPVAPRHNECERVAM
jgi:UDP-2,3-diacylglucosamine pyrophosphatase LpxH